jgi:hypothetical protein
LVKQAFMIVMHRDATFSCEQALHQKFKFVTWLRTTYRTSSPLVWLTLCRRGRL